MNHANWNIAQMQRPEGRTRFVKPRKSSPSLDEPILAQMRREQFRVEADGSLPPHASLNKVLLADEKQLDLLQNQRRNIFHQNRLEESPSSFNTALNKKQLPSTKAHNT